IFEVRFNINRLFISENVVAMRARKCFSLTSIASYFLSTLAGVVNRYDWIELEIVQRVSKSNMHASTNHLPYVYQRGSHDAWCTLADEARHLGISFAFCTRSRSSTAGASCWRGPALRLAPRAASTARWTNYT